MIESRVPSSRVSSTGLTPSLLALEDASTLKRKEWSRGEPGEDTRRMYTTIGGSLTPTAPVYGDMRTDLTLNVMSDRYLLLWKVLKKEKVHNCHMG